MNGSVISFEMANKPFEWAGHHKLSDAQPSVNGLPLKGSVGPLKAACARRLTGVLFTARKRSRI